MYRTDNKKMMRALIKRFLHFIFGEYHYWKVFSIQLPRDSVELPYGIFIRELSSNKLDDYEDEGVRKRGSYGGENARGFALYVNDELASVVWFWWGSRYVKERGSRSWPLPANAAKLVGLYTVDGKRGNGYADLLQRYSLYLMSVEGFTALYARVWHSNTSSIRVFEKSEWKFVGSYVELCLFQKRFEFRIPI